MQDEKLGHLLVSDQIPADTRIIMLLPMLWLSKARGLRGNICVDACLTLQHAYAQFGIRSEVTPVDLVVEGKDGQRIMHGTPQPHWESGSFVGHVILYLPDSQRIVDPTVEQYPQIARYRIGPIIGRFAGGIATPEQTATLADRLPAGSILGVHRGDLKLAYTAVTDEYADVIRTHPLVTEHTEEHRRAGIRFASWALLALRDPSVIDKARTAPFPRLRALLDLLADAPCQDEEDYLFTLPDADGTPRSYRLDEVPLPDPR